MKKALFIAALIATSCSNTDQKFCECIEAGDEFNKKSGEVLKNIEKGYNEYELSQLKAKKDSLCSGYLTMGGEEMRKKMKNCE